MFARALGTTSAPLVDPLQGPLGSKFKFTRRLAQHHIMDWDPDNFVKPAPPGSVAGRAARRRVTGAMSEPPKERAPKPVAKSQSFKRPTQVQ